MAKKRTTRKSLKYKLINATIDKIDIARNKNVLKRGGWSMGDESLPPTRKWPGPTRRS